MGTLVQPRACVATHQPSDLGSWTIPVSVIWTAMTQCQRRDSLLTVSNLFLPVLKAEIPNQDASMVA